MPKLDQYSFEMSARKRERAIVLPICSAAIEMVDTVDAFSMDYIASASVLTSFSAEANSDSMRSTAAWN
jgi:hypothetical protein